MIVRLSGGLGNQMFQYAFGRAVSIVKGEELYLDDYAFKRDPKREYALGLYNINAKQLGGIKKIYFNIMFYLNRKIHFIPKGKSKFGMYYEKNEFEKEEINKIDALYFEGYWQNINYFDNISHILKNELAFKGRIRKEVKELGKTLLDNIVIAVHVRHGDYLNINNKLIYEVPDAEYYRRAMQYMRQLFPECSFCFFSDDIDWCIEEFGKEKNCIFPARDTSYTAQEDIYLMQQCSHYIIANSSFSWWAAFLGAGDNTICVAPQKWYKDELLNEKVRKGLLCNFILMENQ